MDKLSADPGCVGEPLRFLTVDVEEVWQTEVARAVVDRSSWDEREARVEIGTRAVAEMMAGCGVRGTFFFLGCVARRHPGLVKEIARGGHEIACHGDQHDHLSRLDAVSMRADVERSRKTLEDLVGEAVVGYRAPTWSVTRRTAWAVDVLAEAGFVYDASVFPTVHPSYGVPEAPLGPFRLKGWAGGRELLEVPPLMWRVGRRKLPVAGGGYFRLLPSWLMEQGIAQAGREGRPAVVYVHPWEFDGAQPRLGLGWLSRVRMYAGVSSALGRLEKVVRRFEGWVPMRERLGVLSGMAGRGGVVVLGDGEASRRVA
ncbi:DUF3473 domain-containing protein [Mucisphaera sp.]|uniref:DUF3473 domain-containing protein n=1 Tax=Mucisphaera sp. TaxID=2913024 RepID=UPI003D12B035